VAVVLLGQAPGFLQRFLSTKLLRRGTVKVALAPRTLRLRGKSGQWPNPGWAEANGARKAGLVQRVALPGQDAHRLGVAIDLTPVAERAMAASEGMPPAQRHALVLGSLEAALSAPGLFDPYDHVFTVAELAPGAKGPAARLQTQAGPRTAVDHLLREMILNGPAFPAVVRDPSLFLLLSPDGQIAARLDPASPRTSGRSRELSVLAGLEKLFSGHELSADEADYVGAPTAAAVAEAPVAAAAPREAPQTPVEAPAAAFGAPGAAPLAPGPAALGPAADPGHVPIPGALPAGRVPGPRPPPPPGDPARAARHAELAQAQSKAVFPTTNGRRVELGALLSSPPSTPLAAAVAPGEFLDPGVARPSFDAQVRGYLERGHYDRDLAAAISSLSADPEFPLFVESIERRDSSDPLNHKETVVVSLRGAGGRATQVRFDLPTFSPDGYLRMGGVKYNVTRQILARPIIKIRPDTVLITTSYNKAQVSRFGQVASATSAYVRNLASWVDRNRPRGLKADLGSAAAANSGFVSPVEYDNIARTLRSLSSERGALVFSRPSMDEELGGRAPWFGEHGQQEAEAGGGCAVGVATDGAWVLAMMGDGSIYRYLRDGTREAVDGSIADLAYAIARGAPDSAAAGPPPPGPGPATRRYAYSRVNILSQWIPAAVFCGHQDGLEGMLSRAGVDHQVMPPKNRIKGPGWGYIDFKDATVAYRNERLRDSLLMNGLKEVEDGGQPIGDFGPGGPGWVGAAAARLGTPGRARALKNLEVSFIDPVAAELLREDGLPTDLGGVLLYASSLLGTNQHLDDNDMASYRIRSGPELVPAVLYRTLHREMERVRATRESAAPQRLSVASNQILKELSSNASNVEECADLNPLLEAELRGKASWTGAAGGQGGGDTVTRAQRSYHPSMKGIFGYYSPDSAEIGVKRTIAYGAGIRDTRGRLEPGAGAGAPGLLALGELMSPFTAQHSDPPRIGMQSKQGTHTLPVREHTPLLVGSGAERALAYSIGNTFAWKSRAAGVVAKVDEANQLARVDYDDGKSAYVDLSARSVKNSGGGFYVTSKLRLAAGVGEGSRFGAGEVLAYDPSFFSGGPRGVSYKAGLLARVAITALDQTYEDSAMMTARLARRTAALVTMMRPVSLGRGANLQAHARVGDAVGPDTPLATFENVSGEADVAALLNRVGAEFDEAIAELSKNVVASKYQGRIVERRIFYNVDPALMSDSLRALLREAAAEAERRGAASAGASAGDPVRAGAPERIDRDKVGGDPVDGVLIQYFIEVEDVAGPGDKYTVFGSALKSIIASLFEDGEEPYSENGEIVDYVLSPLSIVSRMTGDCFLNMWTNGALIGLKETVLKIFDE
jgi:hypothetical protein